MGSTLSAIVGYVITHWVVMGFYIKNDDDSINKANNQTNIINTNKRTILSIIL